MVIRKAINTCDDGTCRTIVSWYAKGGRSNFAAWNGKNRFLMTAVLEEIVEKEKVPMKEERFMRDSKKIDCEIPIKKELYAYSGYGTDDPRESGHLIKTGNEKISPTITTLSGAMGLLVLEIYED